LALTFLLFLAASLPVSPLDIAAWVEQSGRDNNSIVGDIILSEDTDTSLRVISALAKREDPYVEDIIDRIFYQESSDRDEEYLLEALLFAILKNNNSPEKLVNWYSANPHAYRLLVSNLASFENAFLKSYILLLLPYGELKNAKSLLMSESQKILDEMDGNGGYLTPGRINEVLAVFEDMELYNDPIFSEMCLSLIEKTRQRVVVRRGRETLRKLKTAADREN
jgi:hypothetical protein